MAHYYDPFPPYAVHDPFPLVDPYYMNANPFWPPPNAMMPPAPMMQQPFASFSGGPLYSNFGFGGYQPQSQPMGYPRYNSPRYASPIDAEFEVIDEADELFEEMMEEEAWMSDGERARRRRMDREMGESPFGEGGAYEVETATKTKNEGEVINFDPDENPSSRPLRNAAAYPSDMYQDENKFQGRKPGQAVNAAENEDARDGQSSRERRREPRPPPGSPPGPDRDPREQHVILDEYDEYMNGFFAQPPIPPMGGPPPPPPPPPSGTRAGPSVYTREEEDLIAAMGGRGPPSRSTQEFAGLGTMTNQRGRHPPGSGGPMDDPQQRNYNPEQDELMMTPAPPPGMGVDGMRQEGYLGDSTLKEISLDYSVPIPYLADVLTSWGVPVPIDPNVRLGDMVTGEQAFAVLEAVHTLDIASLHARYSEETLANICDCYDIDIKAAYDFCMERGWGLPFGVRTFLRVEQEDELLDVLAGEF